MFKPEVPGGQDSILLHCCCAPCSGAIVECLAAAGLHPVIFFSNSNITPREEYAKRRAEVERYAALYGLTVVDDDYDHDAWRAQIEGLEACPERGARCLECFRFRLRRAALYAAEHGIKVLTTTLASSRWKDLTQVDEAGRAACEGLPVTWWGQNWRRGGLQPRRQEIIKEQNFYNQSFCGCEFSNHTQNMAKTVLVSGGAGFIGSHVTVELSQKGYDVVIADNFSNCDETNYRGVCKILGKTLPLVKMDFCDESAVRKLFAEYPIDAVIHFAAFKAVGESVREPVMYYRNNLVSFLNVIEVAKEKGCNILFSSSATVYGETDKLPVTEESPRMPATSPYGNTKQMCEDFLRDAVAAYPGIKGIALRYFNPIGAHPSANIGELPRGVPNNLVPYITQTAAGRRECLSIFGNDYPTPDGTCLRDYIDIVDLAKAHVCAVDRMIEGRMKDGYEIFNVGTGRPVSVMELVNTFQEVNNLKLNYKIAPRREGDVTAVWADPAKAEQELGWKAGRDLRDTLKAAWEWEKKLNSI